MLKSFPYKNYKILLNIAVPPWNLLYPPDLSFRDCSSRKTNLKDTNFDVMNRMLCHSDPVITNSRRASQKQQRKIDLHEEAMNLLKV